VRASEAKRKCTREHVTGQIMNTSIHSSTLEFTERFHNTSREGRLRFTKQFLRFLWLRDGTHYPSWSILHCCRPDQDIVVSFCQESSFEAATESETSFLDLSEGIFRCWRIYRSTWNFDLEMKPLSDCHHSVPQSEQVVSACRPKRLVLAPSKLARLWQTCSRYRAD